MSSRRLLFHLTADLGFPLQMSIYATLWSLKFPRYGDVHSNCEWVQVLAQGVLAHVGTPTVGYGYELGDPFEQFLPPPLRIESGISENDLRAVVFVEAGSKKGTPRSGQEYPSPLLVISGAEYSTMSFQQLHNRLCDALRGSRPRLVLEILRPDGTTKRIYEGGSDAPRSSVPSD
jgi:hypothetical protein